MNTNDHFHFCGFVIERKINRSVQIKLIHALVQMNLYNVQVHSVYYFACIKIRFSVCPCINCFPGKNSKNTIRISRIRGKFNSYGVKFQVSTEQLNPVVIGLVCFVLLYLEYFMAVQHLLHYS